MTHIIWMLVEHRRGENMCLAGFCRHKAEIKHNPEHISNLRIEKTRLTWFE